jgi:hypothetical protein
MRSSLWFVQYKLYVPLDALVDGLYFRLFSQAGVRHQCIL